MEGIVEVEVNIKQYTICVVFFVFFVFFFQEKIKFPIFLSQRPYFPRNVFSPVAG